MVRLKFAVFLGWNNDRSLVDRIVKFVKPVIEQDHDLIVIGKRIFTNKLEIKTIIQKIRTNCLSVAKHVI